ncbi:CoA-acylating methylmalonate-semialdehyde dehydrogenase [Amphritea sp. 2_MG-2023]|uniref:CoA-acylating methylmalonate-semialdehyde dehydrogenase n=1 Tax=Amphritea TaxID=515417 RepID=UPI001C07C2BB|nr:MULTISPECIES: CoA-acylating methylmalonate-semialdehyde dehydrogenase [Amphritea]MBU2966754.1 CoA-acylating methylmalonate-semialdehyde dehydrogenase [Amphritea atlantica]MDO6418979.1 CoA-acylating methylmalonate-semialdehyde dehydrogenase [Amphritea sp. 2_MG-2023]
MNQLGHFINGEAVSGSNSRNSAIYNPATGEQTAQLSLASVSEVENAIQIASDALPAWAATPPVRRARVLMKFLQLLNDNVDELALLISQEHGKVLDDAKGEVTRGIEVVEFACGIPHLLKGEYSEDVGTRVDSWSVRQPVGVCAGISPFNFPVMVPLWMFPIAIACGNTFIMKPSEKDPTSTLRLAELFAEAGLPNGVFNVVNGDKEAVDTLLTHPRVSAISFVGSTPIARYVQKTGIEYGKRVQALGGAKNHAIVMPDADIDSAVNALMGAAYGSAGERCMAISVVVTIGDVADPLIAALKEKLKDLRVLPGTNPEADMGPLVTQQHLDTVRSFVDSGVKEGADLVVDGRQIDHPDHGDGYFMGGCLFDNVTPDMRIYQKEIFGPVLAVVRVDNYEQALELINSHEYGNGTAIFTQEGHAAREFATRVQAGMVGINVPIPVPMAFHSFGGWKGSLFGDHHMHGMEGLRFFTKLKTVTSRWQANKSQSQFSMPTMK